MIQPSRGFLELGANSSILTSVAGSVSSALSKNVTVMSLLEFSNLDALRDHLENREINHISMDTQRVVAPTGPVLSLGDTCFYLPALTKTGASL